MVLAVSGVSAAGSIGSRYEVLSVYGNPRSMKPIESVGSNNSQGSIQVDVIPVIEDEVANDQQLRPIKQVASNDYADIIKMQDMLSENSDEPRISSKEFGNSLIDIRDKMMAGVNIKIPEVEFKGNEKPDVKTTSISKSEDMVRINEYRDESEDIQLDNQKEAYRYNKMVSAYETTMMYAV